MLVQASRPVHVIFASSEKNLLCERDFIFGSSSDSLKRKAVFFLEKIHFHRVLRIEKIPYGQMIPYSGKKVPRFAGPKKAVIPPFPRRASPFQPGYPFPPRVSLRNPEGENREGFSRPFLSSAPAFLPGQQGDRDERPTKGR